MRIRVLVATLILVSMDPAAQTLAQMSSGTEWSVDDQIKIARVSSYLDDEFGPPFRYNAAADLVAFVTITSDLESDRTEARLRVWRTDVLRRFAREAETGVPPALLDFAVRSIANRPGISDLKWAPDGSTLMFLVQESEGENALYRWAAGDAHPHVATALDTLISTYDMLASGRVAVYSDPPPHDRPEYGPELVNGRPLQALMNERWSFPAQLRTQRLHIFHLDDKTMRAVDGVVTLRAGVFPSPDGHYLIATEILNATWNGRCWTPVHHPTPAERRHSVGLHELQYVIIDVRQGSIARPFQAPSGFVSGAASDNTVVWSKDSSRAIIPFSFTAGDRCDGGERVTFPGAYEVSIDGRRGEMIHSINPSDPSTSVRRIMLNDDGDRLTLTVGAAPSPVKTYTRTNGKWLPASPGEHGVSPPPAARANPDVLKIREGLNLPPAIYASASDGRERLLEDLAPHTRGRALGRVEPFSSKDSYGRTWEALLAYPFDYRPGQRYPLIVQTHGFRRDAFFAEGPMTTTAFPGRAATARGFMVLTIDENRQAIFGDPGEEGANVVDGYKTALAELDRRGLIDPKRVGVIGWSRTSYHVKYAITHAPELFAAAVGVDGVDFGYGMYLANVDLAGGEDERDWEQLYGGAPYARWPQWADTAPAFRLHRVTAPFRGEANSGLESLLGEWEFYAGLRRLGKPVELWLYPRGQHSLRRPIERRTSQEGSLDWLDYWMNHRKDPNPAKREQYSRWDALRSIADAGARPDTSFGQPPVGIR